MVAPLVGKNNHKAGLPGQPEYNECVFLRLNEDTESFWLPLWHSQECEKQSPPLLLKVNLKVPIWLWNRGRPKFYLYIQSKYLERNLL